MQEHLKEIYEEVWKETWEGDKTYSNIIGSLRLLEPDFLSMAGNISKLVVYARPL